MSGKRRRGRQSALPGREPALLDGPSQPFATGTLTLTRQPSRRELREARRRRRWFTTGGVVAVAVVVVLAAVVAVVASRGSGDGKGKAAARVQSTLLVQLTGDHGVTGAALLAHDTRRHEGVEVLVPSRVLVEVPGYGSQPFDRVLSLPRGPRLARAALSDLMHVTVDASWVLDQRTLATLVDRVGGVTVDVDTDVTQGNLVVVPAGAQQRLDGKRAVAYATYVARGEDPQAGLARLQDVLEGVVQAMPGGKRGAATLGALGFGSQASWPDDQLAAFLDDLAGDLHSEAVFATTLPVVPIDTGGATTYRVDVPKVRDLVSSQLAPSVPAGGLAADNAVYIQNAVGTPGLGSSVRDRLVKAGFRVVGDSNRLPFGQPKSVVLIFSATPKAQQVGAQVAQVLGLPASAVRKSSQGLTLADVVVIVGRDYKP